MKKKIIIILSFILIITNLNGCLLAPANQAKKREVIKLGKKSVEPYLEEKYGMEDVTIKKVSAEVGHAFNIPSVYTGDACVTCEFEGREFEVLISKDRDSGDNYQYPEIISAVEKYIKSVTKHVKYVSNLRVGGENSKYFSLEKYFDGDLSNFLENLEYISTDIYILADNDIMIIQESSKEFVDFVGKLKRHENDRYYLRYINVYFFNYTEETAPELDKLQEETDKCDIAIFPENLLAYIYFRTGDTPEIKYCHYSINQSRLFS